jgi:hypothetical protein
VIHLLEFLQLVQAYRLLLRQLVPQQQELALQQQALVLQQPLQVQAYRQQELVRQLRELLPLLLQQLF